MSSNIQYILDTTVLEDYFFAVNPNSKNWLRNIVSTNDGEIIITPVILIELIRRLYYIRQKDYKKVKLSIKILTQVLRQITFPQVTKNDAKEITRKIGNLPLKPECHVGELSLLPYADRPEAIIVTSDNGVLDAYINSVRLDPRHAPPRTLNRGESNVPNS